MRMKEVLFLAVAILASSFFLLHGWGGDPGASGSLLRPPAGGVVLELYEGGIRSLLPRKPALARGYAVLYPENGQVRMEVFGLPRSKEGHEAFLVRADPEKLTSLLYVEGNPEKGVVSPPPHLEQVVPLLSLWYSLGTLETAGKGHHLLIFNKPVNLRKGGGNLILIFEKKSPGVHQLPEDFSRIILESNGFLRYDENGQISVERVAIFPEPFPRKE